MTSASGRVIRETDRIGQVGGSAAAAFHAVAAAIRADRLVQATLLVYAAFTLLYTSPVLDPGRRASLMAGTVPTLAFLILLLAALRIGLHRLSDAAERRFWGDLSVAVGCWIAAVLLNLAAPPETSLLLGEEALYAAYYVALVMALGRLPHRRPEERPQGGLLALPSFAIFVAGLFTYFTIIPLIFHRREYDSSLPSTYLYLILDAFIIVKLVDLCWRSPSARWRAHYLLLAVTTALFFYNDLYNLPFYAAHTERPWELPEALLWDFQFVLLVLAVRLRHQSFPAAAAIDEPQRDAFAEARESTLVVALLFPCIHFTAYALGYLDQATKPPRDLLMLAWLCALGAVALLQHRRLERRHSHLDAGTARMSAELAWREEMTREQERLIAELEAHNAELEARNAEMERFHYSLSHDLKSPLVTIRGFLGVLKKQAAGGGLESSRRTLLRIRGAARTMGRLLEEVLELSRIGRVEGSPEAISLAELARQAVAEVTGAAGAGGLEIEIDPGLPVVRGHRHRLAEALSELIDNAVKFMGSQRRPRIEIGVRDDGDDRVIYVRDNGNGIEARYRDKVFGLFDRLDHGAGGTGFGLARVRKIVELHGGRIWVESGGPGRGSTFCFTLDARPRIRGGAPGQDGSGREAETEGLRVLGALADVTDGPGG